jgi:hypothetical protein
MIDFSLALATVSLACGLGIFAGHGVGYARGVRDTRRRHRVGNPE